MTLRFDDETLAIGLLRGPFMQYSDERRLNLSTSAADGLALRRTVRSSLCKNARVEARSFSPHLRSP